jgi:hypothetical protein
MSEKKTIHGNKIDKSKYAHYTSQGADLPLAKSEYAEYHEANHHSFFNMNNAAGLFKLIIIGAIILVVIVALSPLFKLFQSLVGAGNAAVGFFKDLLGLCETNGACIPKSSTATAGPKAGVPGTCDGKGSKGKGAECVGYPAPDKAGETPPPPPCGQVVSKTCKLLLLGWLLAAPIAAIFAGLFAAYKEWKNKDDGTQGDELTDLKNKNKELADSILHAGEEHATTTTDQSDSAGDKVVDDYAPEYEKDLPKHYGGMLDYKNWGGPSDGLEHLYKSENKPPWGWVLKSSDKNHQVSKETGVPCSGVWSYLPWNVTACKKEGKEGDLYHGVKKRLGWDDKAQEFDFSKVKPPDFQDKVREVYRTHYKSAKLAEINYHEWDRKATQLYEKAQKDAHNKDINKKIAAAEAEAVKAANASFDAAKAQEEREHADAAASARDAADGDGEDAGPREHDK